MQHSKPTRVLFLGNSHTYYNDMPAIFRLLAEAGQGVPVEVSMQAYPGVTYGWHLSQGSALRYALLHGGFDYMVMQQAAHSPCPSPEETVRDGAELIRRARAAGVTPVITVPWAERAYPEHQAVMYRTYSKLAAETGAATSPVGQVFERVAAERPDIDLYWVDGEHCSPYGSYVNAACAYAMIYGASPEGLPARAFCSVTGTAEDYLPVGALMDQLRAVTNGFSPEQMGKPEHAPLWAEAGRLMKEKFLPIDARDQIEVALDKEKCAAVQRIIWEEVRAQ